MGELSIMIVSFKSRPICERSWNQVSVRVVATSSAMTTYLYVIALVVITTFSEKSVVYNTVDIELVEKRVTVLELLALARKTGAGKLLWKQMQ